MLDLSSGETLVAQPRNRRHFRLWKASLRREPGEARRRPATAGLILASCPSLLSPTPSLAFCACEDGLDTRTAALISPVLYWVAEAYQYTNSKPALWPRLWTDLQAKDAEVEEVYESSACDLPAEPAAEETVEDDDFGKDDDGAADKN